MVMDESNLIVIKEYDSINEAEWDKSLLDGAGIYAMIRNEYMSTLYPVGGDAGTVGCAGRG